MLEDFCISMLLEELRNRALFLRAISSFLAIRSLSARASCMPGRSGIASPLSWASAAFLCRTSFSWMPTLMFAYLHSTQPWNQLVLLYQAIAAYLRAVTPPLSLKLWFRYAAMKHSARDYPGLTIIWNFDSLHLMGPRSLVFSGTRLQQIYRDCKQTLEGTTTKRSALDQGVREASHVRVQSGKPVQLRPSVSVLTSSRTSAPWKGMASPQWALPLSPHSCGNSDIGSAVEQQ